jgi:hypothetical protein
VLPGDLVEGQGKKDGGSNTWTTDVDEQISAAADLIRMWGAKEIYIIGGSKYHVMVGDTGLSAEEMLGQKLGAVEYPNQENVPVENRRRSGPHWFLTFNDVTAHFAHHVGISRVFAYMSTPIARQMMQAKLNDPLRHEWERLYREKGPPATEEAPVAMKIPRTRIVVRAHAHYWWLCDSGGTVGLILPAWKVPDNFIALNDPLGFGSLGWASAEVEGEHYEIQKHLLHFEDVSRPPHSIVGTACASATKEIVHA